jgi:hypothetical protein
MIVNSHNIEFGYELISTLPYAYYLHSIGQLEKTISGNDTECLYYFSPNHEINPAQRSWYNTPKAISTPNIDIHKPFLKKEQFLVPPFKNHYANKEFKFKKETVIICNRYNIEWGKKPINYFSLETLEKLFNLLQDDYQVIYINVEGKKELYDNAPPIKIGDFELLKKYPKVINFHDLVDNSWNETQLKVFANCEKFITMNGGHSILASYFGGENIIMSKYGRPQTRELNPDVNSFYRWYHEFSGQRVRHVPNEIEMFRAIKSQWIDKDPIINILIRTSGRPNYFKKCIESILIQRYPNLNIFCSIDDNNKYTTQYPVYPVYVKKDTSIKPRPDNNNYGIRFPYNLYLNALQDKVKSGIIIYLDDDDILGNKDALHTIAESYKEGNELIFWKVESRGRIIPSDKNWEKAPVCTDVSGIGFAFDSKYKKYAVWEAYKRGDYRVASKLYHKIKNKSYIDQVLSRTQNGQNSGRRVDINGKQQRRIKTQSWYLTNEGGYWYGCDTIGKIKVAQCKMRKLNIEEVPKQLINTA